MSKRRSRRRNRLAIERLERREVPATWGIAWPDPQHLTISLAPDGTDVLGESSTLFRTLDGQLGAGNWEPSILRAVQAWASTANLNVGLVSDGGQPIGAAGPAEGDPRFGDIRVSAAPMAPGVVAVGMPYDPATGTLSGDVIINSNADFNPSDPGSYDLDTILLHEFGHSFGFADSSDPSSFMYNVYQGPVSGLAPGAAAAMQSLYGAPTPDPAEISPGNPGGKAAEALAPTPGQPGVVSEAAALASNQDFDLFQYQPAAGVSYAAGADIRVQSAGISLLDPTVTVFNASGQVIASASASGPAAGGVSVHVGGSGPYLIAVAGSHDAFGVGQFRLSVAPTNAANPVINGQHVATTALASNGLGTISADGLISPGDTSSFYSFTTPLLTLLGGSVSLETQGVGLGHPRVTIYNASMHVVAQATASGASGDVSFGVGLAPLSKYYVEVDDAPAGGFGFGNEALQVGFLGPLGLVTGLVDDVVSLVVPTTPAEPSSAASPIAVVPSAIAGDRLISSLTASVPQAVYKLTPPAAAPGAAEVMTVAVVALDGRGITPSVTVLDNKGNPVAAQVLAAEGGAFAVQLAVASGVPDYLIRVKGGSVGATTWTGSYYFDATFGTAAASGQALASGSASEVATLALTDDELFRFVATAASGAAGTGEQVTIKDASGTVVASATVGEGQSVSLTALLGAGTYTIYVTPLLPPTLAPSPSLLLVGFGLSDPIKAYPTGSGSSSGTGGH